MTKYFNLELNSFCFTHSGKTEIPCVNFTMREYPLSFNNTVNTLRNKKVEFIPFISTLSKFPVLAMTYPFIYTTYEY